MFNHLKNRKAAILLATLVLILAQLACGTSTTDQQATALPPTASSVQETSEPTAEATVTPTVTPTKEPTPSEQPATAAPAVQAIVLGAQGFGQNGQELAYAFLVENPNQGTAINTTEYQVAFYNAAGTVVGTDTGYINQLLPGQTLGLSGWMTLDEGITVDSVQIQLDAGFPESSDLTTTFTTDRISYYPNEFYSTATGVITNPFAFDITDLRVSAIVYNAAGEIIGGGFTYLGFILANASTGVEVFVTSAGEVDHIDLYPTLSGLSVQSTAAELPADAQGIVVLKQGFGQILISAGYGMLVQNPNAAYSVEGAMYSVTLYAADGSVITATDSFIDTLLPNQTLGVSGVLYGDELAGATAEFFVYTGRLEAATEMPTFTAQNVVYTPDDYFPTVTGVIVSPYTQDISNLRVSAICYNRAGEIVGGGFTYLDFVPANGTAAVEVELTCTSATATVELYAAVASLSEFGE